MDETKIVLPESELPRAWYNITADLPFPLDPPLHPMTKEPLDPDGLTRLLGRELVQQEASRERWIEIPEPVRDLYRLWRPTPLFRARRLERALDTPAHIYYKYEGVAPAGSHKLNTAVPQAYYNQREGVHRLTTETGAGQWGSALALACKMFGLACTVYMVRVSYDQKPYRRVLMETWGANVLASPSALTDAGRRVLAETPDSPGSLGLAISEAVEDASSHDDTKYSLGSVLNHVLLHQTVIGIEAKRQMEIAGAYPDVVIGCVGGGSNMSGLSFPFLQDKFAGKQVRLVAVEPTACPTLTRGAYLYDFGDSAGSTPLLRMYTLGHRFVPPAIHAGGLRYHGAAPSLCALYHHGYIEAVAYPQRAVFEAAHLFAQTEGILPAPEAAHAIRKAIDEAHACREAGQSRVILFNLSGHGHFDLSAYEAYLAGRLEDAVHPQEETVRTMIGELSSLQP